MSRNRSARAAEWCELKSRRATADRLVIHMFLLRRRSFRLRAESAQRYAFMSKSADPAGFKGSAKGESPAAPLVTEMARAVIGQKGDDTSIITPNLDWTSMQRRRSRKDRRNRHMPSHLRS